MLFEEAEETGADLLQKRRCEHFAPIAAERIRSSATCLFSLLPAAELEQIASGWFSACAQAMLRGNYAGIDQWIRNRSDKATEQGFAVDDVVGLLWLCRDTAIEVERWDQDIFADVDEVIAQSLQITYGWIPPVKESGSNRKIEAVENSQEGEVQEHTENRRVFGRNRLRFPIRIRGIGERRARDEFNITQNISRGGLYFVTKEKYRSDEMLKVTYPYWTDAGAINQEYSAKITRLDALDSGMWGVAVHFLDSLDTIPT